MKKFFDDLYVYENILIAYFSRNPFLENLFNYKINNIIERFLTIFVNEDKIKGTNHVEIIQGIYSNQQAGDKKTYLKNFNISVSTLQRYRDRYCLSLKLIIESLGIYC